MSRVQEELNTQPQGYVELYKFGLSHLKSSALVCATELGIPSAIHRRGAATISDLVTETGLHTAKLPYLRRLMRVLTVSGVFTASTPVGERETVYTLTPVSQLLVHDKDSSTSCDMSGFLHILARPSTTVSVFHNLAAWFRDAGEMTPFEMVHGMSPWDLTQKDASYNDAMNHGCVKDSNFIMQIVLKEVVENNNMFHGLRSLVDVGGGHGAAAVAIARAFPHIKCSVLDLEQVISTAPENGTVEFKVGDMFQYIPPSDAALLKFLSENNTAPGFPHGIYKYILHCWDDDSCVKILRQCKRAIPARDAGGKVFIINMVVGYGKPDIAVKEAQVLMDMYMMRGSGFEREEEEWKKVFLEAGFSDYRIMPILGPMSIIEVLP